MLKKIYRLDYSIELLTGLHIGGSNETFDIGGADSEVIKNPLTKEPYIPGSSIKGKLKSLLLYRHGVLKGDKLVFDQESKALQSLFEPVEGKEIGITRAIFRDAVLSDESRKRLENALGKGYFTEIKAENSINPIKGTAANPRFIERVPAGAVFNGGINVMVFDGDDEEALKQGIIDALKYLQLNYIGGSGSRGYGRVEIKHNGFAEEG